MAEFTETSSSYKRTVQKDLHQVFNRILVAICHEKKLPQTGERTI